MKSRQRAFRAKISGRVQGVGFRYHARRKAESLAIMGWVRNEDDGSVTVCAEGDSDNLDLFASWLREGPQGAWISEFEIEEIPYTGAYTEFDIEF